MSLILTAVAGALAATALPHAQLPAPAQSAALYEPGSPKDGSQPPAGHPEPHEDPAAIIVGALGEQAHREPGWRDPQAFQRPSPDRYLPPVTMATARR